MRGWTWARAGGWSMGLGALAVWLGWSTRSERFGLFLLVAGAFMMVVPLVVIVRRVSGSSRRAAGRIQRRSRRNDGVASRWAVWRTSGRFAVRRRMRVLKPSTRHMSFVQRMRVPTLELATPLARVGRQRIWSPVEDVTIRIGPPRRGKSVELAGRMPRGRLDPALTLALDEAAVIAPIPLDKWTSDMGGRNITIHIAVQSRAQLKARWGDTGAATIVTNASTMLVFGATDADDLDQFSKLAGERHERTHTHDRNGRLVSATTQRVPVLTPADIAQLAKLHVVIFRPGLAPALGRIEPAYKRRDVRTVACQDARTARRIERAPVRAARRAIWAARWAGAKAQVDAALTAVAAWIERTANGPASEADRRVDPDA